MDLKAPQEKLNQILGVNADFNKLIESVSLLKNSTIEFEFRTTVTPDLDENDIIDLAKLVGNGVNYYLQPYRKPSFLLNAPAPLPIEMLQKFEKSALNYADKIKLR
jgi:pyruvate formate lyase activating enzyme